MISVAAQTFTSALPTPRPLSDAQLAELPMQVREQLEPRLREFWDESHITPSE